MTPLDKTLKRTLQIDGIDYVVTLTPEMLKLTRKGKRLGVELKWSDITSGESALAIALRASVGVFEEQRPSESAATKKASPSRKGRRATNGPPKNRVAPRKRPSHRD